MERARLLSALAAREADLSELNAGLENEVQDRTRELRAAEVELRELNEGLESEFMKERRHWSRRRTRCANPRKWRQLGS